MLSWLSSQIFTRGHAVPPEKPHGLPPQHAALHVPTTKPGRSESRSPSGTTITNIVLQRSSWTVVMEPVTSSIVGRILSAVICSTRPRPPSSPARPPAKPRHAARDGAAKEERRRQGQHAVPQCIFPVMKC
jgi:hypothetical protein